MRRMGEAVSTLRLRCARASSSPTGCWSAQWTLPLMPRHRAVCRTGAALMMRWMLSASMDPTQQDLAAMMAVAAKCPAKTKRSEHPAFGQKEMVTCAICPGKAKEARLPSSSSTSPDQRIRRDITGPIAEFQVGEVVRVNELISKPRERLLIEAALDPIDNSRNPRRLAR